MSNLTPGPHRTFADNASNNSKRSTASLTIAILGAAALFMMFTGLVITTTLLVTNSQATEQAQKRADEMNAARLLAASNIPAIAPTPADTDDVTRSNSGITQIAKPEAVQTVSQKSFDDALQGAAVATQQVTALEQKFTLPDCVAELQELVKTVRIGFAIGSSEPLLKDMEGARRIATIVADCEPVMVAVEGHSDLTGQEQSNMNLSWIRADSIVRRLQAEGFDVRALEPLGFGARKPIALGVTPEANALNRRVQFHLAPRPDTDAALFAEN